MPVFPQVIVEAGFVPTAPGIAGTDLLLDDPVFGLLDTGTLAADDTWTDISIYVQSGTITRQSTRQQGPLVVYQGGTCSLVLNNSDGRFDPQNLAGPYVSAGVTQVRPMIPVRVRAIYNGISYYLFSGFADSWIPPPDNFGPNYDQTVLAASDAFKILNGINLAAGGAVGGNELTGARVNRILTAAGWYSSARNKSVIAAGDSRMQATTYGSSPLSLMHRRWQKPGAMWTVGRVVPQPATTPGNPRNTLQACPAASPTETPSGEIPRAVRRISRRRAAIGAFRRRERYAGG
jgi:hypothetical protein